MKSTQKQCKNLDLPWHLGMKWLDLWSVLFGKNELRRVFQNLAYIAHSRQNQATFVIISKKILKKVISTEVPGLRLSTNISTTSSKQK